MSFARVCNPRMYRSALLVAMASLPFAGCNKPTEEANPDEPAPEIARAETQTPDAPDKAPEASKAGDEASQTGRPAPLVVRDVGFKTPESVYYDEVNDVYLVSNIDGSPTDADNNGFISKVSPDGTVTALTWIAGGQNGVALNAPKGMGVKDDVLYVTDIDTIRMFDMATGAPKGEVAIEGATFLNDISVGPTGTIYVSDSGMKADEKGFTPTGTDAVWTLKEGKAEKLIAGDALNRPNGLLADEGGVWVVTNGGTELYRVTDEGKREASVTLPGGSLDGLAKTKDGNLLISSWQAQAVFQGKPTGTFTPLLANLPSPADIGYDAKRNRVLVPIFQGDAIQIQQLGEATPGLRSDAPEPEVAASKADADEGEAASEKPSGGAAAGNPPAEPEPVKADEASEPASPEAE